MRRSSGLAAYRLQAARSVTSSPIVGLTTLRLLRSQSNFAAVRDHEIAAKVIGVPLLRTKLFAFGSSSFLIGVAGAPWTLSYSRKVEPVGINLDRSLQILFIIIGDCGSLRVSVIGAVFCVY